MKTISLSLQGHVSIHDVIDVGCNLIKVHLDQDTAKTLDMRRDQVVQFVTERSEPAYGFNRGFGHNVKLGVNASDTATLQENLILSHACEVGDPIDIPIGRITMFLRAASLAKGNSGVRSLVVQQIIDFLNAGITPLIPRYGSVSASSDLAPLSHIALGLIGQGKVFYKDKIIPASEALADSGLSPLKLKMKEGLALNNGAQYSNALGIYALHKMEMLLKTASISTAMTTLVMLGSDTPFREDLHKLRPHNGAQQVAKWIWDLMQGSPIREAHRPYDIDGEIQDPYPYNIRCAAQILGVVHECCARARQTFEIEANSVTDNPIILQAKRENGWDVFEDGKYSGQYIDIVSGGHFHGMPIAIDLYGMVQATSIMSTLINVRCARYVDETRNKGLGSDLKWTDHDDQTTAKIKNAVSSGMMIPEYVTASLTNMIWGLSMPSHLFSLSTDAGQEDHVSMAANVGLRLIDALPRLADALAIELAFCAQAAAIRKASPAIPSRSEKVHDAYKIDQYPWTEEQRKLNPVGEEILNFLYQYFPVVTQDRYMAEEIASLSKHILAGDIVNLTTNYVDLGMSVVRG